MLSVGLTAQEHLAVQVARPVGEASLRGGGVQVLSAVELVQGSGEPVDGVALRHAAPRSGPGGGDGGSAGGASGGGGSVVGAQLIVGELRDTTHVALISAEGLGEEGVDDRQSR